MRRTLAIISGLFLCVVGTAPAQSQMLTLEEAVAVARVKSPVASQASAHIEHARAKRRQAEAMFFPMLRVSSSYSTSDNPVNVFMYALNQGQFEFTPDLNDPERSDDFTLSGQATMRLFSGGRDLANRQAARHAEGAASRMRDAAMADLSLEVVRSYLMVLTADEYVRSSQVSVSNYSGSESVLASRVQAGTALKTEWLNIQVQKARAEEQLLQAQNGRRLAIEGLRLVMGLEEFPYSEFQSLDQITITIPQDHESNDRPEAQAADLFARAARAELRAALSGYLPALNAFAAIDRHQGIKYDGDKSTWMAGLSFEWTIFDGLFTPSAVAEKRARMKAAEESARQTRLQLTVELTSAQLNAQEAEQRVGVMERAVQLASESAELTRQRFTQGLALASDVIDAQDALAQAEFGLAKAKSDRILAVALWRRARALPLTGDLE